MRGASVLLVADKTFKSREQRLVHVGLLIGQKYSTTGPPAGSHRGSGVSKQCPSTFIFFKAVWGRGCAGVEADVAGFSAQQWQQVADAGGLAARGGPAAAQEWAERLRPSARTGPWSPREDAALLAACRQARPARGDQH